MPQIIDSYNRGEMFSNVLYYFKNIKIHYKMFSKINLFLSSSMDLHKKKKNILLHTPYINKH